MGPMLIPIDHQAQAIFGVQAIFIGKRCYPFIDHVAYLHPICYSPLYSINAFIGDNVFNVRSFIHIILLCFIFETPHDDRNDGAVQDSYRYLFD